MRGQHATRVRRGTAASNTARSAPRAARRPTPCAISSRCRVGGEYGEAGPATPCSGEDQEVAMTAPDFDPQTRTELEAAAFRRLVEHLRERTDVQNIDLMNLAGFCRNCLSRWYREAAADTGHHAGRPGRARDRLRHAVQGMAGEVPEGGVAPSRRRPRRRSTRVIDRGRPPAVCPPPFGRSAGALAHPAAKAG